MKRHVEISHSDERGSIRDIFVASPKDHCSIITFAPSAVRANHFHKKSTQCVYVIDGELLMATCLVDENGQPTSEVEQSVIGPADLVTHAPYHAHAFRAVRPSTILVFADGVRGGKDYENDVFRLTTSLI